MNRSWFSGCGTAILLVAMLLAAIPVWTASSSGQSTRQLSFLQPDQCYRFVFQITGAPNWKVLEVLEGGWIRAEVDAGPAAAKRESAWINTGQIVTIKDARCSE